MHAGLVAALFVIGAPAQAGIVSERLPVLPFQSGVTLEFATHQIAHGESRYWTRIDVLDGGRRTSGEPSWVRYDYAMYGGERGAAGFGSVEIPDLEACPSLNPWWGPELDHQRPSCDLWLSAEVYAALAAGERILFDIDRYYRADFGVTVEVRERSTYVLEVDDRAVELPVLVVESSAGDELWVLDDATHPLVLWSRVPGVYAWGVTQAWVADDPPPMEPRRGVTALPAP